MTILISGIVGAMIGSVLTVVIVALLIVAAEFVRADDEEQED
ncbi:MAG: hypothetical protein ACI4EA_08105 [Candidatus Ornithomonoglobus sp.]